MYEQLGGLGPISILKLYLKKFIRFVPGVYFTLLFGTYVMPHLHGGGDDTRNPIWFSFEEVLFYRCQEPGQMQSKLLFYSNLFPIF
jgi:hypothetical protein